MIQVHKDSLVVDSHNDLIVAHIRRGNQSISDDPKPDRIRHSGTVSFLRGLLSEDQRKQEVQASFSKLRAGGINAVFCAVDVTMAWKNHLAYALDAFGYFRAEIEDNNHQVTIVKSASDIRQAKEDGKVAIVLVIENSEAIERSLNILAMLHEIGVRSIGLTHNLNTWAATGVYESDSGGTLTQFGVQLVKEMNRLRMLIDVSHISETSFWNVLEVSECPIIASHSNCKAICDHARNLTSEQIKHIAQNQGSIGVTFVESFIERDKSRQTLDRLIDHVDYIVDLVGIEYVGIGSDFDGGGDLLTDATEYPRITEKLIQRGYSDADIGKILGENHLRVFEAACG